MYCTTTVVPERSRDSVSGDVAFLRPAVELLVVTIHGWALPCHTKGGFRTPSSTSYWLKFYHDVFDASANHISPLLPNLSIFRGVMAVFLISPKRQISLTPCFFFFFRSNGRGWCSSIKCRPKISASNSSIYSSDVHIISSRTAGWTSSYTWGS